METSGKLNNYLQESTQIYLEKITNDTLKSRFINEISKIKIFLDEDLQRQNIKAKSSGYYIFVSDENETDSNLKILILHEIMHVLFHNCGIVHSLLQVWSTNNLDFQERSLILDAFIDPLLEEIFPRHQFEENWKETKKATSVYTHWSDGALKKDYIDNYYHKITFKNINREDTDIENLTKVFLEKNKDNLIRCDYLKKIVPHNQDFKVLSSNTSL